MSIKLSFKNFKPFGSNPQTIDQKPIVLVYGPNSAGKSSLIDALVYYHHLKLAYKEEYGDPDYLDVKNPYFAGDKLDLGGFESMVHQKDTTKEIVFETEYDIKERESFGKLITDFDLANELFSSKEYVSNFDDSEYVKSIVEMFREDEDEAEEDDEMEEEDEDDQDEIVSKIWSSYSFNKKMMQRNPLFSKRNKKELLLDDELYCFQNYLDYLLFLAAISDIRIVRKIRQEKHNTIAYVDCYIDGEIVFSSKVYKNKRDFIVYKHTLLVCLMDMQNTVGDKIVFDDNETYRFTDNIFQQLKTPYKWNAVEKFVRNMFNKIFDPEYTYSIQYIGPLRLVPTKDDLFVRNNLETSDYLQSQKKKYYTEKLNISKGFQSLFETITNFIIKIEKSDMVKKFLELDSKLSNNVRKLREEKNFIKLSIYTPYFLLIPILFVPVAVVLIILLLGIPIFYLTYKFLPLKIRNIGYQLKYRFHKLFSKKGILNQLGAVTSERMWTDFVASAEIQEEINRWLGNEKLKTHYKVHIDTLKPSWLDKLFHRPLKKRLSFVDLKTNTKVYPDEMGTGISQILPILISSKMRKESVIFIEQPELHLHPALQSELSDEFIESVQKRENNFLVETHSEHLLLRIMKRMRQTHEGTLPDEALKITPDDVALLYVDSNENGAYITELELDEDGSLLDPWPGGFFEEGFKERFF